MSEYKPVTMKGWDISRVKYGSFEMSKSKKLRLFWVIQNSDVLMIATKKGRMIKEGWKSDEPRPSKELKRWKKLKLFFCGVVQTKKGLKWRRRSLSRPISGSLLLLCWNWKHCKVWHGAKRTSRWKRRVKCFLWSLEGKCFRSLYSSQSKESTLLNSLLSAVNFIFTPRPKIKRKKEPQSLALFKTFFLLSD